MLAAFLAATMAFVLSVFASQGAASQADRLADLAGRMAAAAEAGSLRSVPVEFDPAPSGPRHALQTRVQKLDKDVFPDILAARDMAFAISGARHATALHAAPAASPALFRRLADARAPPLSIPVSATL